MTKEIRGKYDPKSIEDLQKPKEEKQSLRVEIAELLRHRYSPQEYYQLETLVNDILKTVEKRIDTELCRLWEYAAEHVDYGIDLAHDKVKEMLHEK